MYFLIDYENVRNSGMLGGELLLPADRVFLFYSEAAGKMESKYLDQIEASGCGFEACKLHKAGKNALDFYIATKAGALIGQGYTGDLAVVSKDSGFLAVKEYWENAAQEKRKIILAPSLECAMMQSTEKDERTAKAKNAKLGKSIEAFAAMYKERERMRTILKQIFPEAEFSGILEEIAEMVASGETAKIIYTDALRRFGRSHGLDIYRRMKGSGSIEKLLS